MISRSQPFNRSIGLCALVLFVAQPAPATEPFTEEAQLRGIDYLTNFDHQFGHGLAFADLDGDGDPDLVTLGRADGLVGVFENDGLGHFTDRSLRSGIPSVMHSSGVIAGDYDRDGDLDLYISCGIDILNDPPAVTINFLLRNDGDFVFTDVTSEAGVGDDGPGYGCAWADYDNDGWLDLYVSNRFVENRLYHNLGNGTFEEVAEALGVDRADDPTFQSSFFDFDLDGDADLYVANDKAGCTLYRNHFFENIGGTFVEITNESGTEGCVWSMCIAIGDFDGNGLSDMYVTNIPQGNALMMNHEDGLFTREEVQAGVASYATGWGSVFFDYDNDGHLDLYVCNVVANNRLYRHEGAWPTEDVSEALGVSLGGDSYTVATADIDDDGDVDMIVQNSDEPLRLYLNQENGQRSWVKFDVLGQGPARYAIGAVVKVRTAGTWRMREVIAGCNFMAQNELPVHFGLGDAKGIDEIRITWPGGDTRTLHYLATNRFWTLYPIDKLGDGDGDGDKDIDDFFVFADCFEVALEPGCEMMDFGGNGAVAADDFEDFLNVYQDELLDCNDNGILDLEEILLDADLDLNGNGNLDECDCAADLDGSGGVGPADLAQLLGSWGICAGCPADLNGDGEVGPVDLATLLGAWGPCQ